MQLIVTPRTPALDRHYELQKVSDKLIISTMLLVAKIKRVEYKRTDAILFEADKYDIDEAKREVDKWTQKYREMI